MKIINLEENKQLEELKDKNDKIVIQFSANWCSPCRRITPEIKEFIKTIENDNISYVYCDVDKFNNLCESLDIISIPSFVIYDKKSNNYTKPISNTNINLIKKYLLDNDIINNLKDLIVSDKDDEECKT